MKFRSQRGQGAKGQVQVCSVGPRVDAAPAGLARYASGRYPRGSQKKRKEVHKHQQRRQRGRPFAALCIPTDTRSMSSASRPEFCAAWYDVSSRGWCRWSLGLQCLPADGRALRPADRNAWRQCVEAHAALERCLHRARSHVSGRARKRLKGAAGCSNSFALSCGGGQRVGAFLRDTGSLASAQNFGLRAGPMPFSPGR